MKVERIKRDLDMKEFIENVDESEDHTRNVKIVNRRAKHDTQSLQRLGMGEEVKEYFARSKKLLNSYYSDAFIRDQLAHLSDDMVVYNIKETPTRIKRRCKRLCQKLDKYNVILGENGQPDFSSKKKFFLKILLYRLY